MIINIIYNYENNTVNMFKYHHVFSMWHMRSETRKDKRPGTGDKLPEQGMNLPREVDENGLLVAWS